MSDHAGGFVHKENTLDSLREALRAVVSGAGCFTPLVKEFARKAVRKKLAKLSTRERVIAQLVAEGRTNKEIAAKLNLSVKTVEGHRSSIAEKLDIHDVASLTRFAVRHGLVSLE